MIYVVIPVFNRKHYTEACLECLAEQRGVELHVLVVDDGSSDGTSEMIQSRFPYVEIIRGSGDWYWTGSAYQGVERAMQLSESDDDFVLMLNDDLEFDPDLVCRMFDFSMHHPRTVVQAMGSWSDRKDTIQFAGRKINWWTAKGTFVHEGKKCDAFATDHVEPSDTLTGRGVLFPIRVFKEVGNYDRRIVHRGDPELTRRAAKAGWELLVYFGAVVYSYPVEGKGNINERAKFRMVDFREYFFGNLSSAHIPTMWRNARTYTHSGFQASVFFGCHMLRMLWHFAVRLRIY